MLTRGSILSNLAGTDRTINEFICEIFAINLCLLLHVSICIYSIIPWIYRTDEIFLRIFCTKAIWPSFFSLSENVPVHGCFENIQNYFIDIDPDSQRPQYLLSRPNFDFDLIWFLAPFKIRMFGQKERTIIIFLVLKIFGPHFIEGKFSRPNKQQSCK